MNHRSDKTNTLGNDSSMADEEESHYDQTRVHEYYAEGTIVDETMHQTMNTDSDDEDSEMQSAMMKRSEIAMRGRGSSTNDGGLRQSIASFPALLMSQADLNMRSSMNQRIFGMFMRNEGSERKNSLKRISFISSQH